MVKGLGALHQRFTAIPENVRTEVAAQMEVEANKLVRQMRAVAPKDSGQLAASIGWTWGDAPEGSLSIGTIRGNEYGKVKITIYAGGPQTVVKNKRGMEFQLARLQEFGTKRMPANPFFFPTYRSNEKNIRSSLSRAVTRAVKKS